MTQQEMSDAIAERSGITKKLAKEIVGHVVDVMKAELQAGNQVKLNAFGVFTPKIRKERNGVNPRTGEKMVIPQRIAVSFKPSQVIFNP